jgi:hypothetical protein
MCMPFPCSGVGSPPAFGVTVQVNAYQWYAKSPTTTASWVSYCHTVFTQSARFVERVYVVSKSRGVKAATAFTPPRICCHLLHRGLNLNGVQLLFRLDVTR